MSESRGYNLTEEEAEEKQIVYLSAEDYTRAFLGGFRSAQTTLFADLELHEPIARRNMVALDGGAREAFRRGYNHAIMLVWFKDPKWMESGKTWMWLIWCNKRGEDAH